MKILIIDDHALFREGLSHVLNSLKDEVNILEAANYDKAMQCVAENPDLDLILLDLHMPGKNGFTALNAITQHYPALPVAILSASKQLSDIQRALNSGAVGYIPKDTSSTVMLGVLNLMMSGGIYVPPDLAHLEKPASNSAMSGANGLTPRQLQVLSLLIQGHSNKKIAQSMELAESTVKMHVTSILKTLNVSNRTQAAMAAEKLGLCLTN